MSDHTSAALPLPEPPPPPAPDVFLSYNREDQRAVKQIAEQLRELGVRPWFDEWDVVPGTVWQAALEAAIASCRSCAVFVGPFNIGPWQREEMYALINRRVTDSEREFPVIPVLLPGAVKPDRLPAFLTTTAWVEFTGVSDKYAMHRLVSGIKAVPPGAKQDNSPRCEWIVVVTGSVRDDDKCKVEAIIDHVRILSGDLNITFKRVEAGSIRLTLEGSEAALERLQALLAEAGGSITVGDHTIVSVERGRAGAGQESRPRGGGMLTCKQFLEALNDFLAGTVDPEERESLQRHIDQCPNCWVVVDTAARTVRAYGEMGDKGPEGTTIEEALERALRQGVDRKNR